MKIRPRGNSFLSLVIKLDIFFIVAILFSIIGVAAGTLLGYLRTTEPVTAEILNEKNMPAVVYDTAGNSYYTFSGEERLWLNLDEIPQTLQNAFIAIEDERFWYHNGIDPIRIAGVTFKLFQSGYVVGGGSTITQQVVKMLTGEDEFSLKRKVQEQKKAVELEKLVGKEKVLEMYLNMVYLGQGTNGVGNAAKVYFNKTVDELTIAECASLASVARRPTYTEPYKNPEKHKEVRDIVLKKMYELGYITVEEYYEAVDTPVETRPDATEKPRETMPFFVEVVLEQVKDDLVSTGKYDEEEAWRLLQTGGLIIYSTIDPKVQSAVDEVFLSEDEYFPVYNTETIHNERPQGAIVVIDPSTGELRGLAGARGKKEADFVKNLATQEKRQPGSTIKPMGVYAPLIEAGEITAATVFEDLPLYIGDYHPHNYNYTYRGLTSVREAILYSTNVVAVKAWMMLGADRSHNFLKRVGITSLRTDPNDPLNDRNAAMALGGLTDGISLMEMTASYMPLANGGYYIKPIAYSKVVDREGNVILTPNRQKNKVLSRQASYIMTSMLMDNVNIGTASSAKLHDGGIDSAGKTGTSSGYRDRWFIGYSPYYLAGVWYGFYPERKEFPGERQALAVYSAVMQKIHEGLPDKHFEEPPNLVHVEVCMDSGKLPGPYCQYDPRGSRVREEIFIKGTEPKETCDVHVPADICTSSGGLATPDCPDDEVITCVFIRRLEKHNMQPCPDEISCSYGWSEDQYLEVPEGFCTAHQ